MTEQLGFLVVITFDLKGAIATDYECVQAVLKKYNITDKIQNDAGNYFQLPSNTYSGVAAGVTMVTVREIISAELRKAFDDCNVDGNFLTIVCNGWTWTMNK